MSDNKRVDESGAWMKGGKAVGVSFSEFSVYEQNRNNAYLELLRVNRGDAIKIFNKFKKDSAQTANNAIRAMINKVK